MATDVQTTGSGMTAEIDLVLNPATARQQINNSARDLERQLTNTGKRVSDSVSKAAGQAMAQTVANGAGKIKEAGDRFSQIIGRGLFAGIGSGAASIRSFMKSNTDEALRFRYALSRVEQNMTGVGQKLATQVNIAGGKNLYQWAEILADKLENLDTAQLQKIVDIGKAAAVAWGGLKLTGTVAGMTQSVANLAALAKSTSTAANAATLSSGTTTLGASLLGAGAGAAGATSALRAAVPLVGKWAHYGELLKHNTAVSVARGAITRSNLIGLGLTGAAMGLDSIIEASRGGTIRPATVQQALRDERERGGDELRYNPLVWLYAKLTKPFAGKTADRSLINPPETQRQLSTSLLLRGYSAQQQQLDETQYRWNLRSVRGTRLSAAEATAAQGGTRELRAAVDSRLAAVSKQMADDAAAGKSENTVLREMLDNLRKAQLMLAERATTINDRLNEIARAKVASERLVQDFGYAQSTNADIRIDAYNAYRKRLKNIDMQAWELQNVERGTGRGGTLGLGASPVEVQRIAAAALQEATDNSLRYAKETADAAKRLEELGQERAQETTEWIKTQVNWRREDLEARRQFEEQFKALSETITGQAQGSPVP